jgi:hypothetical protein
MTRMADSVGQVCDPSHRATRAYSFRLRRMSRIAHIAMVLYGALANKQHDDRKLVLHRFVSNLQALVDDGKRLAQLLFVNA